MDDDRINESKPSGTEDATLAASSRTRPPLRLAIKGSGKMDDQSDNDPLGSETGTDSGSTHLAEPTGADRREQQRRTVLWPARLMVGRHEVACQIWNLSLGGARIRCDLPLRVGTPVSLKIPGIDSLAAHISWGEGDSMGLRFVDDEAHVKRQLKDRLSALGIE